MKFVKPFLVAAFFFLAIVGVFSQNYYEYELYGEEAIAERYLEWAAAAMDKRQYAQAEAFLERAADYASVSSDLSYMLAMVRGRLNRPRGKTLEALRLALETDRWKIFSKNDAALLESATLIAIKKYAAALRELSFLGDDEKTMELKLTALKGQNDIQPFKKLMVEALDRYPQNTVFPRLLFNYAKNIRIPDTADRDLIDLVLRRLKILLEYDPDLAYIAAPFIADEEDARRILLSWRAERNAHVPAESLPVSLNLGVINEETAVSELFQNNAPPALDKKVMEDVFFLLRTDEARDKFIQYLTNFSGTITSDTNNDGIVETTTDYSGARIVSCKNDSDQDGVPETVIVFSGGAPLSAELGFFTDQPSDAAFNAFVTFGRYPAVKEAALGSVKYFFRPQDFFYPVIQFTELAGTSGFLYPEQNNMAGKLTESTLLNFSYYFEKPSSEFKGAMERIECYRGIPLSSKEFLDGKLISHTDYKNGLPVMQMIDLDLDGRLETRRYFIQNNEGKTIIGRIENDADGDGTFEYKE